MKTFIFFIISLVLVLNEQNVQAQNNLAIAFKSNRQFIGAQFNPYYKTIDQLFETDYYQGKS